LTTKLKVLVAATGIGAILSGCQSLTPEFDANFGTSVTALRAQQTADPDAPTKNQSKSVEGLDGRAARESLDRYYKSFREPPPKPPTFVIGVGDKN